ncbi:Transcriptional regulator MET31 [Leucoagaricus sp. SymC.cos]|nr:Transcriptional regulator MET31 [Leucoagaricus sp. SymC.cos]
MHRRDTRPYYDDPNAGGQFQTSQYPSPSSDYPSPSTYYDYQQTSAYYPQSDDSPSPFTRSMTPGIHSHRYSGSTSNRDYYSSSGILNSSSALQQPYSNQASYYNSYPENRSPSNQTQFIPTPSEMANSYTNYPMSPHSPQTPSQYGPAVGGYHSNVQVLPQPQYPLRPSRISTGRPRTASGTTTSPTSATSPSGERFPCEKCGKTFSRSHDRKRHHETQHLPTPVIHRCRYCEKEFSRADSLKRHLDNGCDEMPQ